MRPTPAAVTADGLARVSLAGEAEIPSLAAVDGADAADVAEIPRQAFGLIQASRRTAHFAERDECAAEIQPHIDRELERLPDSGRLRRLAMACSYSRTAPPASLLSTPSGCRPGGDAGRLCPGLRGLIVLREDADVGIVIGAVQRLQRLCHAAVQQLPPDGQELLVDEIAQAVVGPARAARRQRGAAGAGPSPRDHTWSRMSPLQSP